MRVGPSGLCPRGQLITLAVLAVLLVSSLGVFGGRAPPAGGPDTPRPASDLPPSGVGSYGSAPVRPLVPHLSDINIGGYTHMTISASETVGNITVAGNATLAVQGPGVTLSVYGNITVAGNGTFDANRSGLDILQSYAWEFNLQTMNNARVSLLHTIVVTGGSIWLLHIYGDSNVTLDNATVNAPNWFGTFIAFGAHFNILYSVVGGDIQLQQGPGIWNGADVRLIHSSGFDILTSFPSGSVANVTLPSPNPANRTFTWINWTFPGAASVTGVDYTITLYDDQIWHVGAYLFSGSDVTITNSLHIDIAFFQIGGTTTFSGLRDWTYPSLRFGSSSFSLQLYHVRVEQFTWYPEYAATVRLLNDDIGQVIPQIGASSAFVGGSNYTGLAGPLAPVGSTSVTIQNSTIYSQITTQSTSFVLAQNCSLHRSSLNPQPLAAQATGSSTIVLEGTTVDPGLAFQAQQLGQVIVEDPVNVTVEFPGGAAAPRAPLTVRWTSNSTLVGTTSVSWMGTTTLWLREEVVRSAMTLWLENYTLSSSVGPDSGQVAVVADATATAILVLTGPVVISSYVANPALLPVGTWTNLSAEVVGSSGSISYVYTGLPGGCSTSDLSVLPCRPTSSGSFTVRVYANDTVGDSGTATVALEVLPVLSIRSFSASPAVLDLGGWTNFTVVPTGVSGSWMVTFTGLPPGCLTLNATILACHPTATGAFVVSVFVNDTANSASSASTPLLVDPSLVVTASLLSAPSEVGGCHDVNPGALVVNATASGGDPPFNFTWTANGTTTSTVEYGRQPSFLTGGESSWNLTVKVKDATGAYGTGRVSVNIPLGASCPSNPSASHPLPLAELAGGVGGAALVVAVVLALLLRRRSRAPPKKEGETPANSTHPDEGSSAKPPASSPPAP